MDKDTKKKWESLGGDLYLWNLLTEKETELLLNSRQKLIPFITEKVFQVAEYFELLEYREATVIRDHLSDAIFKIALNRARQRARQREFIKIAKKTIKIPKK